MCRIDPIIPGLNDADDDLAGLVTKLAAVGVKHIVASTLKLQPSSAKRFRERFPDVAAAAASSYDRSRRVSGYHYLAESVRRQCIERVRALALEQGIAFSCCREGFAELNTAACDGRGLVPDRAPSRATP